MKLYERICIADFGANKKAGKKTEIVSQSPPENENLIYYDFGYIFNWMRFVGAVLEVQMNRTILF